MTNLVTIRRNVTSDHKTITLSERHLIYSSIDLYWYLYIPSKAEHFINEICLFFLIPTIFLV